MFLLGVDTLKKYEGVPHTPTDFIAALHDAMYYCSIALRFLLLRACPWLSSLFGLSLFLSQDALTLYRSTQQYNKHLT